MSLAIDQTCLVIDITSFALHMATFEPLSAPFLGQLVHVIFFLTPVSLVEYWGGARVCSLTVVFQLAKHVARCVSHGRAHKIRD